MDLIPLFKALSNDKRLQILQWLKHPSKHFTASHCNVDVDGVCVGLIEAKADITQSTVSQYLSILQQAGLITMKRQGQWTYCKRNEKKIKEFIAALKQL